MGSIHSKRPQENYRSVVSRGGHGRHPHETGLLISTLNEDEILVGEGEASWNCSGHDAEIEWCLIFARKISRLEVNADLSCLLQGAIRERRLGTPGVLETCRENVGSRSVIAVDADESGGSFGGLKTTLGDVVAGRVEAAMKLEYAKQNLRGKVERNLSSQILKGSPLIDHLKIIQKNILAGTIQDTNIVRLRPERNSGGYMQERWLKYRSALTAVKGTSRHEPFNASIRCRLVSDVVTRQEYIRSGSAARLDVYDRRGKNIGSSILHVL